MNTLATDRPLRSLRESAWLTPVELAVLGAIWGASFLFMRVAANDFGPMPLVEVRLGLGSLVLLPFLWRSRSHFASPKLWGKLALIGAINSAVPFMLFAWAAQRAPAGVGAISNAMTVLFTALVGFLFFGEKIGAKRAVALFTGFAGRRGAGQWQDRGREHRLGGPGGQRGGVPLRHRHQPGTPPPDRPAAGGGGVGDAGHLDAAHAAVCDRHLAAACDPAEVVAVRGHARRAVHGHRLRHVLPPDRPCWCESVPRR
jgi:multidrug transporter EmrE-like cation transporter